MFLNGKDLEARLKARLTEIGCVLESSETADHTYKLDFLLYRLAGIMKPLPISVGVQVTADPMDRQKQRDFLEVQRRLRPVQKSVYLLIDSQLDVEGGGAYAVLVALGAAIYGRATRDQRVLGLRVAKDYTFESFDLAAAPGDVVVAPDGNWITGTINYYKRAERFGFIGWDGTPDHWFSGDHVDDPALRGILEDADLSVSGTPILFQSAGVTREGEKRPTAVKIRRLIRAVA